MDIDDPSPALEHLTLEGPAVGPKPEDPPVIDAKGSGGDGRRKFHFFS